MFVTSNNNENNISEPTLFVKLTCNVWDCLDNQAKYQWFIDGGTKFIDCMSKLTAYIPSERERSEIYEYISPFSLNQALCTMP